MTAPVATDGNTDGSGPLAADAGAFLASLQHRAANTRVAYRRDVERFLAFLAVESITTWREVDAHLVRRFVARSHRDGSAPRSLSRRLSALRALFRYLGERRLVDENPVQGVRAPRGERRLPRALDVDEMGRMLDGEPTDFLGLRDQAMFELLYSSGLRVSELVGLDRTDLSAGADEVRVLGKGGKERVVPVGRRARAALERWFALRAEACGDDEAAVFVSRRGGRLSARSVQQRLRRFARARGLDAPVHPHMLRHSFASHVLESSGDLRAVQELLGHSNISTTQIYTHLDFQHLARVYDAAHPRARKLSDDD